ncbi:acyl-CoA-binding protein [Trichonephila inaurata madagascariensis]|uniref:Acyl-CoA-binding protein n=2 Tax=Trichonephila inaurata madagascariensis TaxID=2747483 RepID=A0A8X7C8A6_9ARAC|nr:acyl-CoA-binding protein [Trichonephila inaurata madagascariensis]
MSLNEKFEAAAASVKDMKSRPSDAELLELYALYKQATSGDCSIDQPSALDLKGKAKFEAWNGKKGMAQDAAKEAYVSYANTLVTKY